MANVVEVIFKNNSSGGKISHIKLIRAMSEIGLKEAKDIADKMDIEAFRHRIIMTNAQLGSLISATCDSESNRFGFVKMLGESEEGGEFCIEQIKRIDASDAYDFTKL